jgi:hypothetical protein
VAKLGYTWRRAAPGRISPPGRGCLQRFRFKCLCFPAAPLSNDLVRPKARPPFISAWLSYCHAAHSFCRALHRTKAVCSSNAFWRPSCIVVHHSSTSSICSAICSTSRRRRAICCLQRLDEPDRVDGQASKSRAQQQRGVASHQRSEAAQLLKMMSATGSVPPARGRAVPAPGSPVVALLSVREVSACTGHCRAHGRAYRSQRSTTCLSGRDEGVREPQRP